MGDLPFAYITLYPLLFWLLALILGGGLGWLVALLLRLVYRSWPMGRSILMILPWRAVSFALLWLLWSPFFIFLFRIRELPAFMYDFLQMGLSLPLVALILTVAVLVHHWFPSGLFVRLASEARTLAVATVMIGTLAVGANPSENFVRLIRMAIASTFDTGIVWQGWLYIFLAMLAFDLLPGIVQMVVALVGSKKKTEGALQDSSD